MSEPVARARDHDRHDLELVARSAAGELVASEAVAARDLLGACDACAALATDLRAIAAATRALPSARTGASPAPAPRDFRLTESDAARLRRRSFGISWRGGVLGNRARGLGGALATLGLVGLLVSAGLPGILAGAGGAALAPDADAKYELTSGAPAIGPAATNLAALGASDDANRQTVGTEESAPGAGLTPIAIASAGALLIGIAFLLAGRSGRRARR
ncbi:MAG TPA: hypothetical protein VFX65_06430 [Candidatus Limnocylindrales bacterium]|nr:hypothetical protein [Candidatus Limnocylindrales bacterium]